MRHSLRSSKWLIAGRVLVAVALIAASPVPAEPASPISNEALAAFNEALQAARESGSEARQRLAVRRVIRDAEQLLEAHADAPERFRVLEFLFRARQRLVALEGDAKYRSALLETSRELVKAPDAYAALRLEADLLLSQVELAQQGANAEARAQALLPFVNRYLDTEVGAKVVRIAMAMALELGDTKLIAHLREVIARRFAADLEMINFQRDKLGGQVFGAPFAGTFERVDGQFVRFPMDGLGRSTMCLFWSTDNGEEVLKGLAAAALERKEELAGRLEIVSFNLDDLPDAGESIVRGLGVDWQVLRLPGGREHPVYRTYVRTDPRRLTMSPTGQAAMIMTGTTRSKAHSDGTPDYSRLFQSTLARSWTHERYTQQLASLMAGEFLVFDPTGRLDPDRPMEWQAAGQGTADPLARGTNAVPTETMRSIQECFPPPPRRYRMPHAEVRDGYLQAVARCREAIARHPDAPDLWIVRNRLIVALMGLWKTEADLGAFDEAVVNAKAAVAAGYPAGCDLVARFCLAREAFRDPASDPGAVIDTLVAGQGGSRASGPTHAVALLLALDVADRARFEHHREVLLEHHTEAPAMWLITAFLLDRHHDYWMFQVPFTAGWSYGRRQDYFLTIGDHEAAHRVLHAELRMPDGQPLRIPEDLENDWTMVVFSVPGPWSSKRDDGLPPSPRSLLHSFSSFAAERPLKDVDVMLVLFGGDAEATQAQLAEGRNEVECPVLTVPGGLSNPLVHRLGLLSEDHQLNSVLLHRDGRIALVVSGMAKQGGRGGGTLSAVILQQDEQWVAEALQRGDVEAAKERIFALAPPFDPEAVDERGRKLRPPKYALPHLRARARVYLAMGERERALADAEEVVDQQMSRDGGMSLRTDALDEAEALQATILDTTGQAAEAGP